MRFILKSSDLAMLFSHFQNNNPSTSAFMAQLFDAVHGVALALSDLVNKKQITRSTNVLKVREKLYNKLKTFDDPSSGYPSATGKQNVMYFDQRLDGPPRYDVVNLQVGLLNEWVKRWCDVVNLQVGLLNEWVKRWFD